MGPFGDLGAFQVELNLAAAHDALPVFFVFATMRVYDVVPRSGFSENRDFDVFQQARGVVFKVRRSGRLYGEKLLRAEPFRKGKFALLSRDTSGRRRRSFLLFSMGHPLAVQ